MPTKSSPPISRVCPRCGSERSVQVSTSAILRYSTDRRCTSCQKVYSLPAPRWAGVLSLLVGGLMAGACLAVMVWKAVQLLTQDHSDYFEGSLYYGMTCMFLTGGIGVFIIIHGLRLIRQKPVAPPQAPPGADPPDA